MASHKVTADRLRSVLAYSPDTGRFCWLQRLTQKIKVGAVAGTNSRGYVSIRIDGTVYAAHRLAFLWMTGSWPAQHVDHINGDRGDNRWCNLRDVPPSSNSQNRRGAQANSTVGLLGVSASGNRFVAKIQARRTSVYIGSFETAEEAHSAYLKAKRSLHPGSEAHLVKAS